MSEEPMTKGRAPDHPDVCETCRFWADWGERHGACRRRSPGPCAPLMPDAQHDLPGQYTAYWPVTREHDWCGEHEGTPTEENVGTLTREQAARILEALGPRNVAYVLKRDQVVEGP